MISRFINKKSLCVTAFAVLLLIVTVQALFINKVNSDKVFYQNRYIEYKNLIRIINDSKSLKTILKEKWGSILIEYKNHIIIPAESIYVDTSFQNVGYEINGSDFYGYEFVFDDSGNLEKFNLYKP